jgi:hypothetical protein
MIVGRVSTGMALLAHHVAFVRHAPSPAAFRHVSFRRVSAAQPIEAGPITVPRGAAGMAFDLSQDEIEVDFYSPKHVIAFATRSQLDLT